MYRFQQRVSGVKVLNGQVVVSDPRGAPPDLVADSSKPSIEGPPAPRVGRAPAIEAALRSAGVRRLRGHWSAGLAIEPGDGGTLVWRVVIPAARPLGDFEVLDRRRLGPCGAHPGPAPALEARPRAALQPEPGGREQRLLRAAQRQAGQEHPAVDLAAPAGHASRHQGRAALPARQVGARQARPRGEGGLQAGPRLVGGEAVEGPLRGLDDLLPHRSRPALHPGTSGSAPGARRGSTSAPRSRSRTRSGTTTPASRRRPGGSSTAAGASTTPRTPT